MKLLVTADIHYTLKQLDWISKVAGEFDLVVIAGDLLDITSIVDLDAQILVVLKYLSMIKAKVPLLVSSGNHDLDEANDEEERGATWLELASRSGIVVDGNSLEAQGILFTVCPWWDGPETKSAVARMFERDAVKPKDAWFWIYHAPPDDSPISWTGTRHFGDAELSNWIKLYRPDYVLGGHVHQSPFKSDGSWVDRIGETWVFNGGRQIGPIPTHIVLDTEKQVAQWYSLAGNEEVPLDRPLTRPLAEI